VPFCLGLMQNKAAITTIPWKDIYGMRNRIVQGYADVSMEVVWDTAKKDMQPLIDELQEPVTNI
jgi:uncharacterized protein with HEPN domain